MSVSVKIPTPLRRVTGGVADVSAAGGTVRELIEDLERQFPGMRERLCDETGALRRFVNVFVGDEDIRFLEGIETAIEEGAQVSIIPAVAGG
ncbi:MAG: MoaD/ThiS family protein [Actinomycetota bacterium]